MAITTEMIKNLRETTGAGILDCRKALEQSNGDMNAAMDFLREKGLATATKRSARQASEGVVELYSGDDDRVSVMVELNSESDFVGRSEVFRGLAHDIAVQLAAHGAENVEGLLTQKSTLDSSISVQELINQKIAALGENIIVRRFLRWDLKETTGKAVVELYTHGNGRVGVMVELGCESDAVAKSADFKSLAHEIALQVAAASPEFVQESDIPQTVIDREAKIATVKAKEDGKPDSILPRIIEGAIKKFKDEFVLMNQANIRDESITVGQLISQKSAAFKENIVIRRFARWALGETTSEASEE